VTLSTKLTISRLISVPVYLPAYLLLGWIGQWVCLVLVWWAAFSDIMDGRLARSRGEVSDQGKFLDPIADSSFFVTVFFCFAWSGLMPWWMLLLIACREAFQNAFLRPFFNSRGVVVGAKRIGKAKTVVQSIVAQLVLFTHGLYALFGQYLPEQVWPIWLQICFWLLALVTALSVGSLYPYVMTFRELPARSSS